VPERLNLVEVVDLADFVLPGRAWRGGVGGGTVVLRAVWPELGEGSRGSRRHPAHGSRLGRRGLPWWLGCLSSSARSSRRTGMRPGTSWALPFGRSGSPFSSCRSCSSSGYDDEQCRESAGGRTLRR